MIDSVFTDPDLIAAQALTADNNQSELQVSFAESVGIKATNPYLQQLSASTGAQLPVIADVGLQTVGGALGGGLSGGGGIPCFVGETLILMADWVGKPIKDIELRDHVMSFDVEGNLRQGKVVGLWKHLVESYAEISFSDGRKTCATLNHRYWQKGTEFKEIGQAKSVQTLKGKQIIETKVFDIREIRKETIVYNITVSFYHNYIANYDFVSNLKPAPE